MPKTTWTPQFFSTTRGRILKYLCVEKRTVAELADDLGLTGSAVRAHLAGLMRDGLVESAGSRRAARRPKTVYDLTPQGQRLFPKVYGPLLARLLDVMSEQLLPDARRALVEQAARRLFPPKLAQIRSLAPKQRLARLMDVLEPVAELERAGKSLVLRGCGCPMASAVTGHPELCQLAAAMLTDLLDMPVQEKCDRADSPHCRFEIGRSQPSKR